MTPALATICKDFGMKLDQTKKKNNLTYRLRLLDRHRFACLHEKGTCVQRDDGTVYAKCAACGDELDIIWVPRST